jgi:hypothetical protein
LIHGYFFSKKMFIRPLNRGVFPCPFLSLPHSAKGEPS